jgi:hypothetical protein
MRRALQIFEKGGLELRGKLTQRQSGFPATADRLVVHVCEIHHALDLEAARLEVPLEQVLEDVSAEVADVRVIIDRGSAGVHRHAFPRGIERDEFLERARVAIEEAERHGGRAA